jgi:hypothetical protein
VLLVADEVLCCVVNRCCSLRVAAALLLQIAPLSTLTVLFELVLRLLLRVAVDLGGGESSLLVVELCLLIREDR